jgi:hypothetical protein
MCRGPASVHVDTSGLYDIAALPETTDKPISKTTRRVRLAKQEQLQTIRIKIRDSKDIEAVERMLARCSTRTLEDARPALEQLRLKYCASSPAQPQPTILRALPPNAPSAARSAAKADRQTFV